MLLAGGEGQSREAEVHQEAASAFEKALEIARSQGTRMLELRATMSLCRLLQRQGEYASAHTKLQAIHGWFTEGLETPDLQAAAALLDELSSQVGGAT